MTDEQIIKNAERHKLGNCSQCDYKKYGSNCLHELLNDSIKMAKRLCDDVADFEEGYNDGIVIIGRPKAELKTVKAEIGNLKGELKATRGVVNSYKLYNKRLLQELQQAKSEALMHAFSKFAGHSDYHGDTILCQLKCMAEGKEIKSAKPIDINEIKSEEIKDFAERLKSKLDNLEFRTKTHRKTVPTKFCDDNVNWVLHECVPEEIDKLVKEMNEVQE